MAKRTLEDKLIDLVADELGSASAEEIRDLPSMDESDTADTIVETRSAIQGILKKHRDSRREALREEMAASNRSLVRDELNISDPIETMLRLISTGKIPSGLTLAFRDGERMPPEEALEILREWKALGIDVEDD